MEMMEMLTGTSVIRMGIYRDHGAMQIPGTRGKHAITPDTLWCSLHMLLHRSARLFLWYCLSLECEMWRLIEGILDCVWSRQGSPAHWAMIGPSLPGQEYFWHTIRGEGSSHLLSELIIALPSAHWPHIDSKSDNNIDNQGWITYLVALMLVFQYSISQRNWSWLNARVSGKCVCQAFCDRGLISSHEAAFTPHSHNLQQTASGGTRRVTSEEHDLTWDGK